MNPVGGLAIRALRDPKVRALLISLGPSAARAAADLARQGRWRQLAVVHADAVVDGSFLKVPIAAQPHWIVWSGDTPVASYPPVDVDLDEALASLDLSKRQRPQDLRIRALREQLRGGRRQSSG